MMDDLISRTAALNAIDCWHIDFNSMDGAKVICKCRKTIENLPAVDAAPVVFCKDCKYAHMTYGGEVKYCDRISMPDNENDYGYALYLPGDWFCADGERRDEDA